MRYLLAIAYADLIQAEQTRLKFLGMQQDYLLQMEDLVIAVKQPGGKLKLNQAINLTATGALQGSFLGLLVGLLFLNPLLGIIVGIASGAVAGALADIGIDDEMMLEMAVELKPGGAILFVLAHDLSLERVIAELEGNGGKVLKTSLRHADENALKQALASTETEFFPMLLQEQTVTESNRHETATLLSSKARNWSGTLPETIKEAKDDWRNEGNPN